MPDPLIRLRLIYTGRVQGVGFRATVRAAAKRFGATGWVRNEPDGTVLAEIQGPRSAVDACLAGIADAMSRNIHKTSRSELEPVAGEDSFEITY
tara:strand:+ start:1829 stop:2110 length:282 start_codon:yes stop_codon:yes gene_type:complete